MTPKESLSLVGKPQGCGVEGCGQPALSLSEFCWDHLKNRTGYRAEIEERVRKGEPLKKFYLKKAVLMGVELQGADLSGADLQGADLSNANLSEVNLHSADLSGADLYNSDLTGTNLSKANLFKANLSSARLWHANAQDANLTEAKLSETDLLDTNLAGARLWRAELENARFLTKYNFTHRTGRFLKTEKVDEKSSLAAEETYRTLKNYFSSHGRYNDASWASYKEKILEQRWLWENKNIAFIPSALMHFLSGYGEKPWKVITSSLIIVSGYCFLYLSMNTLKFEPQQGIFSRFWDSLYFSIVTFTTVGYGDVVSKSAPFYRMLACSEAFIGAFMIGLFVFTLSRRYAAR